MFRTEDESLVDLGEVASILEVDLDTLHLTTSLTRSMKQMAFPQHDFAVLLLQWHSTLDNSCKYVLPNYNCYI